MIHFKYKAIKRPDGTFSRCPVIPISLDKFDTIALIDSGADISAMFKEMAESLDLNMEGEQDVAFGVGGKVKSLNSTISFSITQGHEKYQLNIPIKIILDDFSFPLLLGRRGFFNEFVITFDENKERFSLTKVNNRIY
ncbi:MAG: retropepsin-like aspartic protease [Candidatus Pacearchaeota archaeon]|nr:retropepsin-like aspartic protease [Candidatus Pacearchaeota archaeon]